jgi:hypothetical protein
MLPYQFAEYRKCKQMHTNSSFSQCLLTKGLMVCTRVKHERVWAWLERWHAFLSSKICDSPTCCTPTTVLCTSFVIAQSKQCCLIQWFVQCAAALLSFEALMHTMRCHDTKRHTGVCVQFNDWDCSINSNRQCTNVVWLLFMLSLLGWWLCNILEAHTVQTNRAVCNRV